jgi:hypothetical protein
MQPVFYELQLNGYVPVIAHPERNREIRENPSVLYSLVKHILCIMERDKRAALKTCQQISVYSDFLAGQNSQCPGLR